MIRESFNTLFNATLTSSLVAGTELNLGKAFTTGEAGHWIGESFNTMAGKNCKLVAYVTAVAEGEVTADAVIEVKTKQTPATFDNGRSNATLATAHTIATYTIPKEKMMVGKVAEFVLGDDVENFIQVSAKGDAKVTLRVEFVPYA